MTLGPPGRGLAQDLIIVAVVAGFESLLLATRSATLGMSLLSIEVRALSHTGPVPLLQAVRRSIPVALCYTLPSPGTLTMLSMPLVLGISMGLSPFRRAFHERISNTLTVVHHAPAHISKASLELWWDPAELPTMCAWGRVPDLDERRRARAHRLDGVWWMAALVVLGTLITVIVSSSWWSLAWLTLAWMIVFVVDEARRIATTGTTPGHEFAGFEVVDLVTGTTPTHARALARAAVLAPFLYVPPLQLLLGLWVRASSLHRGPHDLAGRTVVIERGYQLPQLQVPQPVVAAWPTWGPWPTTPVGHVPPYGSPVVAHPGWPRPHPGAPPPAPGTPVLPPPLPGMPIPPPPPAAPRTPVPAPPAAPRAPVPAPPAAPRPAPPPRAPWPPSTPRSEPFGKPGTDAQPDTGAF